MSELSDAQIDILEGIQGAAITLSLSGCLFMIVTFHLISSVRTNALKFVIALTYMDLIFTIGNVLGFWRQYRFLCYLGGLFRQTGLSAVMWSVVITYLAYSTVKHQKQLKFWSCLFLNIFLTLLSAVLPTIGYFDNNQYQYQQIDVWCALSSQYALYEYTPCWICILISIFFSIKTINFVKSLSDNPEDTKYSTVLVYPLILVVCYIPSTINRILILFGYEPFWLGIVDIVFMHSQGFFNAIYYGRTQFKKIKQHYHEVNRPRRGTNLLEESLRELERRESLEAFY